MKFITAVLYGATAGFFVSTFVAFTIAIFTENEKFFWFGWICFVFGLGTAIMSKES